MSFMDRILGRSPEPDQPQGRAAGGERGTAAGSEDERALERYRYMLRTAPPEDIERAHEEAFAALSAEQRRMVLQQLGAEVPAAERATADDPRSLARMATRAELRQPGTMERTFGGAGGGIGGGMPGLGSMFLYSLAGSFVGSAIAQSFFANDAGGEVGNDAGQDQAAADGGDAGSDGYGDAGAETADTADFGGGDFGGGDFGGGDF